MTNEQINRAVAEELGWEPYCHPNDYLWSLKDKNDNIVGKHSRGGFNADHCWNVCNLDFCTDHNAAAEIRKWVKNQHLETQFETQLCLLVQSQCLAGVTVWMLIDLTPRQQAEAFLRMRGKWRE